MAMNEPKMLAPLTEADVQASIDKRELGTGLAWHTLFPLKYSRKFDLKGIEGNEGTPITADRVAFNAKAPIKSRKKVGTWSGKIGKISVSREKDEIEINEYEDDLILAQEHEDSDALTDIIEGIYDDYEFVVNGMEYRVELDSLRIATSGKQEYNAKYDGDAVTADEINFNIPAKNQRGVKVAWSEDTADGLQDIIDAQAAVRSNGYAKPMYCFMNLNQFNELAKQASVAKRLYPRASADSLTTITPEMVDLESINAFMNKNGYPRIVIIDSYVTVQKKDGSEETFQPWAENVVVLSRTAQLGWTHYKRVPEAKNVAAQQNWGDFYKVTRYSDLNPLKEVTMSEAYVQCSIINRRSYVLLDTKNNSWKGGKSK